MKLLALAVITFSFALQLGFSAAQSPEQPSAFALTLALGKQRGEFSKDTQVLMVTLTNTSKGLIREDVCTAFGGLYRLSVVYNGVSLEEPTDKRAIRETKESAEAGRGGACEGSNPGRVLSPGQ